MQLWLSLHHMQQICTHKMGSHSSKPSHAYPVIRLPREFKTLAGQIAHVYQTQNDGKLADYSLL